jgi:hypothetical protein
VPRLTGRAANTVPLHAQCLTACCGLFIHVTYSVVLCKTQCDHCLGVSFRHLFDPVLHDITDVPPLGTGTGGTVGTRHLRANRRLAKGSRGDGPDHSAVAIGTGTSTSSCGSLASATQRWGDKIPIRKLSSRPMSVIAALDCGEYLALAADGMVTDNGGIRMTAQKLHTLPDRPFAWGFSGSEGTGFKFRDWLRAWQWPEDATWTTVGDAAIEELSRLNGRNRRMSRLAGVDAADDDLANVLMAGYIGGVPDILELTDRGAAVSVKEGVFGAIGAGHPHAALIYYTTRALKMPPSDQLLGLVMSLAAHHAPQCGPPIRILKIDPTSVTELTATKASTGPSAE